MLDRETIAHQHLQLAFGPLEVQVGASSALLRLLAVTHRRHAARLAQPRTTIRALSVQVPAGDQSPEHALRAAHRTIACDVAQVTGHTALDAVVVERDGRALALAGPSGSGRTTLAVHLLARGWKLVGDGNAFLDADGAVRGNHALVALDSAALPHLPRSFRPAVERSRWHAGEGDTLRFYGVDPAEAYGEQVWSASAHLHAVAALGGAADDVPAGVAVCALQPDRPLDQADRVEAWFDAHAVA